MNKSNPRMLASVSYYGLATVIRGLSSLIMLPIYTRYLSPADYGVIELLGMILDLAAMFVGARLAPGLIRLFAAADTPHEQGRVIFSSIALGVILNLIAFIALFLFSGPVTLFTFGDLALRHTLNIYALTLITTVVSELGFVALRAMERPEKYLSFSVLKLAIQILANIYFLIWVDLKVIGVVYAALVAGFASVIAVLFYLLSIYKPTISTMHMKELAAFSAPIAIAGPFEFYMVFGDRYFIRYFSGVEQVGIYALAYKFGFLLVRLSWGPLYSAWEPKAYRAVNEQRPLEYFHFYFILFMLLVGGCGSLIAGFSSEIVRIVTTDAYYPAAALIPPIILAYLAQSVGDFCKLGVMVKHQTRHELYAIIAAAFVATIAYCSLIPYFGAMGAAWASVLALCTKAAWQYFAGKYYFDMQLPIWRMFSIFFVLAAFCVCANSFALESLYLSLAVKAMLFSVFSAVIWLSPILPHPIKEAISKRIKPITGFKSH